LIPANMISNYHPTLAITLNFVPFSSKTKQ